MQITLFGENELGFWIEERTEGRPHVPDKRELLSGYSYRKWDRVPTGESSAFDWRLLHRPHVE